MARSRDVRTECLTHAPRWIRLAACFPCLCAAPLCTLAVPAVPAAPARNLYDLTIETGMPHLEENLRYATRYERRCVDTRDLAAQFPILHDVSLQDCRLVRPTSHDGRVTYALQCSGGHGTTGQATWQLEDSRITGTLDVRLGGKNMTFYQRIIAKPLGKCE